MRINFKATYERIVKTGEDMFLDTETIFPFLLLFAAGLVLFLYILPVSSLFRYIWECYILSKVDDEGLTGLALPPGTMGYPFIGETLEFLKKGSDFYAEKMQKYGKIYKTHLLGQPTIRVIGAENIKKILLGENTIVTQHWPESTRLLLGSGSISQSSGNEHKVRRKHMMYAFGHQTLDDMVPMIQDCVRSSLQMWVSKRHIFVYPEAKLMAFSVASATLFGMDEHKTGHLGMEKTFQDFLANLMTLPYNIPGFGFHKGLKAKNRLIQNLRDILSSMTKTKYNPVMHAYYKACEKLESSSESEILEGVIDLLFAGHETITSAATNCVMFLGKHPEVVNRLRAEIKEKMIITEHNGETKIDLSFDKVKNMNFVNAVIKEVLRLCPPAGGGFRKALQSFELGGYLIPKDWKIIYSIRETQHTSPLFEEAEKFRPDRWEEMAESSKEFSTDAAKFHYVPFGFGARSCIGKTYAQLVLKIFVIELVQNCSWTLKNEDAAMKYIPIPVAVDHLPAEFALKE